jgi:hypothetical protein
MLFPVRALQAWPWSKEPKKKVESFYKQRKKLREIIDDKLDRDIDGIDSIKAVYFKKDLDRFSFNIKKEERKRIGEVLGHLFGVPADKKPEGMLNRLADGGILVAKQYKGSKQGIKLFSAFLIPKIRYWHILTDIEGIEKHFHIYNAAIALGSIEKGRMVYCCLQTEGTFWGFTRTVNLPMKFIIDRETRSVSYVLPSQEEMVRIVDRLAPTKVGRSSPMEKFMDRCRSEPLFAEKQKRGLYRISNRTLRKIYHEVVDEKSKRCEVKITDGCWRVYEEFSGFCLVTYYLRSMVNVAAFVPNIPFISDLVEKFAQHVSDKASLKYLPLSMMNFRDAIVKSAALRKKRAAPPKKGEASPKKSTTSPKSKK